MSLQAQIAGWFCVLLLPALLPARSEELGRLFFTPEHREALDRQRESNATEREEAAGEKAPPEITIDGVVTRSSGKRTVWVNGQPRDEARPDGEVTVIPRRGRPGEVTVLTADGPEAQANVGDTLDRTTGEIVSSPLGGGSVRVKAPR